MINGGEKFFFFAFHFHSLPLFLCSFFSGKCFVCNILVFCRISKRWHRVLIWPKANNIFCVYGSVWMHKLLDNQPRARDISTTVFYGIIGYYIFYGHEEQKEITWLQNIDGKYLSNSSANPRKQHSLRHIADVTKTKWKCPYNESRYLLCYSFVLLLSSLPLLNAQQ